MSTRDLYVSSMIEFCARCGGPAGAVMSFEYAERSMWLDDLDRPVAPGAGYALCARHADRITPPLGWTLSDRRNVTRLFAPLEVA